ncbi:por secretion system C-terminal sorting domain [Bacteroidales bacterium 6E]|nr:por secretion system C-terminal sorting domain [Bacteroidales bacterium 6E]
MKKFTRFFLLGERSVGLFLRKIGLSLVVLLFALASFAQGEAQSTLEVWAKDASFCYQEDNMYEVDITMKDFIAIHQLDLKLNFNGTQFSYVGTTWKHALLSSMTATASGNVITIAFTAGTTPVTILESDNAEGGIKVATLRFSLNNTPYFYSANSVNSFTNGLTWGDTKYKNNAVQDWILTYAKFNGNLKVDQKWASVEVDVEAADCFGGNAVATVSVPANAAGMLYSWNGDTFTSNTSTNVVSPSVDQQVVVKDATGCISYIETFDVEGPAVVSFETEEEVSVNCPGGHGDIEIFATGGTSAYTYYVVPAASWSLTMTATQLANFDSPINIFQKPEGTYMVAVQDKNGCVDLTKAESWTMVSVFDELDAFASTVTFTDATCNNNDGTFTVALTGGTAFENGYNIYINNVYVTRASSITRNNLTTGDYTVMFQDANGCTHSEVIEIDRPDPITFDLTWEDTGCQENEGSITVSNVEGGVGPYTIQYTTVLPWATATTHNGVGLVADNLEAGIYYVRVMDATGCVGYWSNEQGDDAVKVLDTDFDITYAPISCYGGETTVTISVITGSGNHELLFSNDGTTWVEEGEFEVESFTALDTVLTYWAMDVTADSCVVTFSVEVEQPAPLSAYIVPYLTLPPTCPEGTDGNLAIQVSGGTPLTGGKYKFKIDEGNYVTSNALFTFLIDNKPHDILIEDANGCTYELTFDFPDFKNKISFQDTIWTSCPMDKVNLFNGIPETCAETAFGFCVDGVDMDNAYFNIWESQWHGVPLEHFLPSSMENLEDYLPLAKAYLTSLGMTEFDVDALIAEVMTWGDLEQLPALLEELNIEVYGIDDITEASVEQLVEWMSSMNFEYSYWTSDQGWKYAITQGVQPLRNPMLYYSATATTPDAIYAEGHLMNHTTALGAGTYYIVARDEFGCYSNVEKVVIIEPAQLEVTLAEDAAGCFGATDGVITITAENGSDTVIPGTPFGNPTLQYAVVNNPAIFNVPNWYAGQVTWLPMDSNPKTLTVQAGTYYIAVRDYCAIDHPELIVINSITIDGADELIVDTESVIIKNVTCNIDGDENGPSNDGHIMVPATAVTGGYGNYTFTLDVVTYEASLKSASVVDRFPESNSTGVFTNLAAGTYTLTVTDDHGCYTVEEFEVTQPDAFRLETAVAYPSCFNEHDGFIRYMIYGGTGPFQETTNNVGEFENVNLIPENRWVSVENGEVFHDFLAFDRRVRNGHYEIYVRDANGCVYGPVKVQVLQPAQLGATTSATAVSCVSQNGSINPVVNDGTITVMPSGGWNKAGDGYVYTIQLLQGTTVKGTVTQDVAASYTFTGLTAGNYTVKIVEKNASLPWQLPIIASDPDYFAKFHDYASQLPWQNPDANCFYTSPVITVGQPEPIDYDIEFNSVVCRNTATGSIELTNVTGGTAPYWFAISGPVGSGYEANPLTTSTAWKPLLGDDEYTWTGLIHGHYNIYIKDAEGCTIFRESGEVNNVDSLTVNMKLNENAQCFEGLGEIEVIAGGGVGGYKYAVSSNTYNFNTLGESGLVWQDSPVFEKPAGVWVGYVKDANGCIQGGPTTKTGVVIQNHRVTILEPAEVVATTRTSTAALCYDDASGKINISGISGGNGGKYSARVTGNDFSGAAVDKFYTAANVSDVALTLTGLKASTSKAPTATLTNADKYQVVVYDSEGCESDVYYVAVHQPEEFEIIIRAKQDAFICSDDKAGLFEIIVARGGTPFSYDTNNKGIYEYKWEAYTEAGVKVDSLTGNWGYTSSFLGYADIHYYVTARDKNGCIAEADTLVTAPAPVVIEEIKDISCFGDANATARVTVSGEEGRTFQVRTLRFAGSEEYLPWSAWSEEFESSIELNSLTYGNESEKEGHYKFQVRDNMGCLSEIETMTFVPVQHELAIVVTSVAGECTGEVTALVNGGIAPYDVYANGELLMSGVAANTSVAGMIASGTYELRVVDAHECELVQEVTVASNPVVVNETFEVFVGEEGQYVNAEYGVDSLLNASDSPYTFTYTTEEGCVRTLVVTVVEVVRQVAIADIQGDSWASPVVGATRGITGTVTGVVPGVGYFVQDAVAPWSGIWVVDAGTVVLEGNGVHVEGVVAEINEVTSLVGVGTVVNPPLAITPISVDSPSAAADEMYESVLVKVSGARATEVNPDGSWSVYYEEDDNIVVDKLIFEYEPVAGHFYDVTGIVFGALDVFKLEPRKLADIRDITATTDVNIVEGVSFKVYPNPFNNELNIDNHDKLVRATITNIAGQRVMDVQYPERVIRTANLVSGVYVVTLFTEDGIVKSERIVKR